MKIINPDNVSAASLLQRAQSLLRNAARLMGGSLEIWSDEGVPLSSSGAPHACLECGHNTPAVHQACQRKRAARCRAAATAQSMTEWSCPHHLTLTLYPVPAGSAAAGALLCIDPGRRRRSPGSSESDPAQFLSLVGEGSGASSVRHRSHPAKRAFLRDLTHLLSDQVVLFREMSEMAGELSTRYDELQMLYTIAGHLTQHENLRQTLRQTLEQARTTVEADAALLSLEERRLQEIVVREGASEVKAVTRAAWIRLIHALNDLTVRSNGGLFIGNPWEGAPNPGPFPLAAQSLAVVVRRHEQAGGILALLRVDPGRAFRSSDIKLLQSVSEQVSLAITNSELYEDLKGFLMATVKSLVGAIEAKDSYTSGHSERVNLLSLLIGKQMNLDDAEMETLRWASILHDVGKIGMPERILCKPGKLTPEELEVIRQHPDRGYRLLSPIQQLSGAAAIVRSHHEMVNGKGYPEKLRGTEIPNLARIIAVADTFDALTTDRPYRTARSLDFALEEIQRVRGEQLDADIVDLFFDLIPFLREHRVMIESRHPGVGEQAA